MGQGKGQEGSGWRKGKKKIKIAGAKTERLGGRATRDGKSAPARWLPSPWGGLEREGGSVSREKEGVLKTVYIQRNSYKVLNETLNVNEN